MKIGSRHPRLEMAAAREDPLTDRAAQLLRTEKEYILIEFLDRATADPRPDLEKLYRGYLDKVHPTISGALNELREIIEHWASVLSVSEIGQRKGAVVERVVELLLQTRMGLGQVHRECGVVFLDGTPSIEFDVLGSPTKGRWEGVECKWSVLSNRKQALRLEEAATKSNAEGGGLLVGVASTKSRRFVERSLKHFGLCGVVYYAVQESLFALDSATSWESCAAK